MLVTPTGRPSKRFCPSGHDTYLTGRDKGFCSECHRARSRECSRRKTKRYAETHHLTRWGVYGPSELLRWITKTLSGIDPYAICDPGLEIKEIFQATQEQDMSGLIMSRGKTIAQRRSC